MKCCICNDLILPNAMNGWDKGNNAEPVMEGRCCDMCDGTVVMTRRINNAIDGKDPYEGRGLFM